MDADRHAQRVGPPGLQAALSAAPLRKYYYSSLNT